MIDASTSISGAIAGALIRTSASTMGCRWRRRDGAGGVRGDLVGMPISTATRAATGSRAAARRRAAARLARARRRASSASSAGNGPENRDTSRHHRGRAVCAAPRPCRPAAARRPAGAGLQRQLVGTSACAVSARSQPLHPAQRDPAVRIEIDPVDSSALHTRSASVPAELRQQCTIWSSGPAAPVPPRRASGIGWLAISVAAATSPASSTGAPARATGYTSPFHAIANRSPGSTKPRVCTNPASPVRRLPTASSISRYSQPRGSANPCTNSVRAASSSAAGSRAVLDHGARCIGGTGNRGHARPGPPPQRRAPMHRPPQGPRSRRCRRRRRPPLRRRPRFATTSGDAHRTAHAPSGGNRRRRASGDR